MAGSLAHSELTLVLTFHREVSDKPSPATHINYCLELGQILGHSSLCLRGRSPTGNLTPAACPSPEKMPARWKALLPTKQSDLGAEKLGKDPEMLAFGLLSILYSPDPSSQSFFTFGPKQFPLA